MAGPLPLRLSPTRDRIAIHLVLFDMASSAWTWPWAWTGSRCVINAPSPRVQRQFCTTFGSHVTCRGTASPGEFLFRSATLDDPTPFTLTEQVHSTERPPWAHLADGLPQ